MKKQGFFELPLHTGRAPRWLFERMVKLSLEVSKYIVMEFGTDELIKKIANPFWFQAFGCLLGFDWHSSGITTTVMGALKEALKQEKEIGIFIAGGKGKTARQTPKEIEVICDKYGFDFGYDLIRTSKIVAKIDNCALQDGFSLYHHTIVFTTNGQWCIIQQGMDSKKLIARRYHWLSENNKKLTLDPHHAICCDEKRKVLNLVDRNSAGLQENIVNLSKEKPEKITAELELIKAFMPKRHNITLEDINTKHFKKILETTYEKQVSNFEELLLVKNVGGKFLRALALTAEIIYGDEVSFRDPARFSFAHGGKDGHPFPVSKYVYDHTIEVLSMATQRSRLEASEKRKALNRLYRFAEGVK